ncbi:hypothetical protein ACWD25_04130 [Streptomyces sp. NPDC002920]
MSWTYLLVSSLAVVGYAGAAPFVREPEHGTAHPTRTPPAPRASAPPAGRPPSSASPRSR